MKRWYGTTAILLVLFFASCSQRPAEIHYQQDECVHCKMMISDSRFASQIVTDKGKVYKFDSIECMASYHWEHSGEFSSASVWVSDFTDPGTWIDGKKAAYVKSNVIKSPMGVNLLAVETPEERQEHLRQYPGKSLQWSDLKSITR